MNLYTVCFITHIIEYVKATFVGIRHVKVNLLLSENYFNIFFIIIDNLHLKNGWTNDCETFNDTVLYHGKLPQIQFFQRITVIKLKL